MPTHAVRIGIVHRCLSVLVSCSSGTANRGSKVRQRASDSTVRSLLSSRIGRVQTIGVWLLPDDLWWPGKQPDG